MICNAQFLKKKWRIGYANNEVFIIYWGIYIFIAARKRHRQDACGLEVLGNKVIDEGEDISQEEEENS